MLNTPGEDAHDGDLELDFEGLEPDDGPDPDEASPQGETSGPADERLPTLGSGSADDCKPLDDELEQIGYELYSWEPEELDALDDAIHEIDLPHEWVSDGWELVVHAKDEHTVDEILPHLHGAVAAVEEEDDEEDATPIEVVADIFDAVSRLRRDPTGSAVDDFLDSAEAIGTHGPFGVEDVSWGRVVAAVDALIDGYHANASSDVLGGLVADLDRQVRPLV